MNTAKYQSRLRGRRNEVYCSAFNGSETPERGNKRKVESEEGHLNSTSVRWQHTVASGTVSAVQYGSRAQLNNQGK